jgi:hypothetical protein
MVNLGQAYASAADDHLSSRLEPLEKGPKTKMPSSSTWRLWRLVSP